MEKLNINGRIMLVEPGQLMGAEERDRLIANIADAVREVPREIQLRQILHFTKADPAFGDSVAAALGLSDKSHRKAA